MEPTNSLLDLELLLKSNINFGLNETKATLDLQDVVKVSASKASSAKKVDNTKKLKKLKKLKKPKSKNKKGGTPAKDSEDSASREDSEYSTSSEDSASSGDSDTDEKGKSGDDTGMVIDEINKMEWQKSPLASDTEPEAEVDADKVIEKYANFTEQFLKQDHALLLESSYLSIICTKGPDSEPVLHGRRRKVVNGEIVEDHFDVKISEKDKNLTLEELFEKYGKQRRLAITGTGTSVIDEA